MSFAFLVAAALQAQVGSPDPKLLVAPPPTVLFDRSSDGVLWALGTNYKMRFDAHGAQFIPAFGSRSPTGRPLAFAAPSPAEPVLAGTRVTFDRGDMVETYDLAPDRVEQSFVLRARPAGADFTLSLPVLTDLRVAPLESGLEFTVDGIGSVRYGGATISDARGRTLDRPSQWDGASIRVTVPAAFLATARFPVVIDPVITTFTNVDGGATAAQHPTVAYARLPRAWQISFERTVNLNDHDIVARRFDLDMNFLDEVAVDITTKDTVDPKVSTDTFDFMTVWTDQNNVTTGDDIRARGRVATNTSQFAAFDVAATAANERAADVGGTTTTDPPYLVVFETETANHVDIAGRMIGNAVAAGSVVTLNPAETTTDESSPAVSHGVLTVSPPVWTVVWCSGPNQFGSSDVEGITVGPNMALLSPITNLSGVTADGESRCDVVTDGQHGGVASDPQRCLVVWEKQDNNDDSDVVVRPFQITPAFVAESTSVDLSVAELGQNGALASDQRAPAVGFDGCRFVIAYDQNQDVFETLAHFDSDVFLFETHVAVAQTSDAENSVAIASANPPLNGHHLIVWQADVTPSDVRAALFSSLSPGGVTVVQTGCGGAFEPLLAPLPGSANDAPTLGAPGNTLAFNIGNLNAPLFLLGAPVSLPLCPGQGGCVLGAFPTFVFAFQAFNGEFGFGVPCDPAVVGLTVAMQIVDQIPPNSPGPQCGPFKFNAHFRTSDTLNVTFQ